MLVNPEKKHYNFYMIFVMPKQLLHNYKQDGGLFKFKFNFFFILNEKWMRVGAKPH